MNYLRVLEDWLMHRMCRSCGSPLVLQPGHCGLICPECSPALEAQFLDSNVCLVCGAPRIGGYDVCRRCRESPPAFESHRSVFLYHSLPAALVVDFKGRGHRQLSEYFAAVLADSIPPCDLLVPVPFRPESIRRRPFDPVSVVVKQLSRRCGIPWVQAMYRKKGRSQKSLNQEDRARNMAGAVGVRNSMGERLSGKIVCLVDDVFTTGATVHACAGVLLASGTRTVHARTIAMD